MSHTDLLHRSLTYTTLKCVFDNGVNAYRLFSYVHMLEMPFAVNCEIQSWSCVCHVTIVQVLVIRWYKF